MIDDCESVAPKRVQSKSRARVFTPEEEAEIRALYAYDPETGVFTRKTDRKYSTVKAGDVAGCINDNGNGQQHWSLFFKRRKLKAHRVAFFLMMGRWPLPGKELDHRDGNPLNNKFSNIRECTHIENMRNKKTFRNNTSGYKGVSYLNRADLVRKFQARIRHEGKLHMLGLYHTAEEAGEAYLSAALFLHGEFVNLD